MKTKLDSNSLENTLNKIQDKWYENTIKLSQNKTYQYMVDVISGWFYYTPTYALQEFMVGKDSDTIIKTRLIGMAAQAIAMRPVGLIRNHYAKKWNITKDSATIDKIKVNLIGSTPIQSVIYAGMLVGGMGWSGDWDWKASAYAWGIGITFGALHSVPYGMVQDKVRSIFGVKPAIDKQNNSKENNKEYNLFYKEKYENNVNQKNKYFISENKSIEIE